MKQISQREARRLQKRVRELESIMDHERAVYACDWPGGVNIGSLSWEADNFVACAVYTARRLKHAVVAVSDGSRRFNLFAIPHKGFEP
jgi:hypothetical protein